MDSKVLRARFSNHGAATANRLPVLTKLETREDVRAALLPLIEARGADLPVLQARAADALRLAQQKELDTQEVVSIVESDPPLAARILGVANSAFYRREVPIRSIRTAVVRLGTDALRDVIYMAVYATTLFDAPGYVDLVRATFDHSVVVARVARLLAARAGVDADDAFLAGLLHDVGRARMYKAISRLPAARDIQRSIIHEVVDELHERAGGALARAWQLPDAVVIACERHHHPGDILEARVIQASDRVSHWIAEREGVALEEVISTVEGLGVEGKTLLARVMDDLEVGRTSHVMLEPPPPAGTQATGAAAPSKNGLKERDE